MSGSLSRKLRQLDDFLLSEAVGDDAMLLSELDGFLAGLIVCPDLILPGEWLPVVWGGDEPVFDGLEQAKAVNNLIMGHYNDILRQLDRRRYAPVYDIDRDDSPLWEIWIEGLLAAMRLRPQAWLKWTQEHEEDDDLQQAWFVLTRLAELAINLDDLEPLEIDEELEDLAPDLIPVSVETLHHRRLARQSQHGLPFERAQPKVGRNDPCPCGSGKKYKKCCGRN